MNIPIRSAFVAAALVAAAVVAPAVSDSLSEEPVAQASFAPIGAVFVPIASYRTIDTRGDGQPPLGRTIDSDSGLAEAVFVQFEVDGVDVLFPDEAVAVTYNVTVTETQGGGFVQVDGFANATGETSTVNWSGAGQTVANSGVAQLTSAFDDPGALGIYIGGSPTARAHVVLDITGYYMPLPN